jgi:hypothetical protein
MLKDITLLGVRPDSVYAMNENTNLLYRFKGAPIYMMNSARAVQTHRFAEAMAECYLIPRYDGDDDEAGKG